MWYHRDQYATTHTFHVVLHTSYAVAQSLIGSTVCGAAFNVACSATFSAACSAAFDVACGAANFYYNTAKSSFAVAQDYFVVAQGFLCTT